MAREAARKTQRLGGLLKSAGWGTVAVAMAMMTLPAEAFAQHRGVDNREARSAAQSSRWGNIKAQARDSRARVQQRSTRVGNRSERRAPGTERRVDRPSQRSASRNAAERNRRANTGSPRHAERQRERRAERHTNRSWRDNDRRADAIRGPNRGEYRAHNQDVRRDNDQRWQRQWDRDRREARRDHDRRNDRQWNRHRRADNARDHRRWSRDWRRDHRYDWRNHRQRYRHVYRVGRYYAPYNNWNYRRLSVGFTLGSLFYSNRYWIDDPWQYRLPEVYGPYRWVRYYEDVLLVNIHTGEVVDVIHDFFW